MVFLRDLIRAITPPNTHPRSKKINKEKKTPTKTPIICQSQLFDTRRVVTKKGYERKLGFTRVSQWPIGMIHPRGGVINVGDGVQTLHE